MPNVGFPFLGVTLRTLEIDTDKDWKNYGISNLKEITKDAPIGSLNFTWRDKTGNKQIMPIPIGEKGQILVSGGPSHAPFFDWVWETPGAKAGLERSWHNYIYALLEVLHMTPDQNIVLNAPTSGDLGTNQGPAAGDFREAAPTITSTKEAIITTPDQAHAEEGIVDCALTFSVA